MRFVKWVVAIVVLIGIAIGALFMFFPTERVTALARAGFEDATGRQLTIGSVRPSLFPLGLNARDISISNADWSDAPDMVTAEALVVSVETASLFSGTPRIREVLVVAPEILLETDADGRANWDFGTGGADAEGTSSPDGGGAPAFVLDALRVEDGALTYRAPGQLTEIENLGLETALPEGEAPLNAALSARLGGVEMSGDFSLARAAALFDGTASDLAATLNIGGATAGLTGTLDLNGDQMIAGALALDVPQTGTLMQAFGLPDPDLPDGFGRAVKADANLAFGGEVLSLDQLAVRSGPSALSGALKLSLAGEKPHLGGALSTGMLDLSTFASDEAEDDGAIGWSKDPIGLSGLDAMDADVAFSATEVLYGTTRIADLSMNLSLADGRARAVIRNALAYGGNLSGDFSLRGGSGLSLSGDFAANDVALQAFMSDMFDFDRILGSGDVDGSFTGAGSSMHGLMNSLNGSGNINFGKGELRGFDLLGMLRNLDTSFSGGGSTIFDSITASFEIVQGVVTNVDLNFLAPLLEAVGEGTIGLGDQTINYRVTPKLLKGEGAGISVPVLITGSWDNLKFRPDLEGLIDLKAQEALKAVEDEIKQQIENEVDKAEDQLKEKIEGELTKGLGKLFGNN